MKLDIQSKLSQLSHETMSHLFDYCNVIMIIPVPCSPDFTIVSNES